MAYTDNTAARQQVALMTQWRYMPHFILKPQPEGDQYVVTPFEENR